MITFQRENCAQVIQDIQPLLVQHWEEVANYKDVIKLNPDFDKYLDLEKKNLLVIITCREDTTLIGYSVFFLYKHIHYQDHLFASNDVLFLIKCARKGRQGIKLIRESERILKTLGVLRLSFHVKPKNDFSPILSRIGYGKEEIIMGKLLGESHGS